MSQTALTMKDGSVQTVDNDQIAAAVAGGATPPESVRVTTPTGTESQVPWDVFQRLSKTDPDLRLTSQDSIDSQAHLSDLENDTSMAGAFGRSGLEALSFGLYKPSEDQALADSHFHGVASKLGTAAGLVGPLLIPGLGEANVAREGAEVANLIREGGSVSELARAGGRLGTELLPGRMTAQVGARISEAAGGGLKGMALGGAAEGAGNELLRAALDRDHQLSAESVLESAGMYAGGAMLGHSIAKGYEAAVEGFERVTGKLGRGAGKVDDVDLVARLNENRPLTAAQRGTSDTVHGRDVMANVQTDLPLFSANQQVIRDAGTMVRHVTQLVDATPAGLMGASSIGKVPGEFAQTISEGVRSLNVIKNFARLEPEVQARVMGAYESHLHNVDELATMMARPGSGIDPTRFPTRWRPENVAARQEALAKLDLGSMSPVQAAAERLSARMTVGTGKAVSGEITKGISDNLLSRVPVIGKVLDRARLGPLGSLLVLDRAVEHGLLHIAEPVAAAAAVGKLAKKAFEVPGRGIALSGLAADNLSRLGVHGNVPTDRSRRALYIADRFRSLSPDDARAMASHAAQHIAPVSSDTFMAVGDAAARRHSALQQRIAQIFPQARGAVQMSAAHASAGQVRALDRTLSVAGDPVQFVRLLGEGKLSTEDMALARQVWPAHVRRATQLAGAWLADNQGQVPRSVARRLEVLLGPDAVGSVHADTALAVQSSIAASNARLKAQPAPSPQPSGGKPRSDLMSPSETASGPPQR